jgi:hypothetical protein
MRRVAGMLALLGFVALAVVALGVRRGEVTDPLPEGRCPATYALAPAGLYAAAGAVAFLRCAYAPTTDGYVLAGSTMVLDAPAVGPAPDRDCATRAGFRYLIVLVYRARPPVVVDPDQLPSSRAARACR